MRLASSIALCAALLLACAAPPSSNNGERPLLPEAASGTTLKPAVTARRFAVATANPLATAAGYETLKAGGSAVDAAVAVQMVLALVEPQSSGLGGGAFLLHDDGREVQAFDGRETAPAAADQNLFLDARGKPLPFYEAAVGGRSVGTPGTVRLLEMAHRQYGRLAWADLLKPAIALAENGFKVSPRLNALLANDPHLRKDPVAAAYFYQPDGAPLQVGAILRNPAFAATLRRIAAGGARAFYEGDIAQAIVHKVQNHPTNPGKLSLADLAAYEPKKRAALCHDYRAAGKDWRICGFPPPSSGAIAIGQILGMLNHTHAATLPLVDGQPSAQWLHLYAEASRLAFADRAQYVADPDFVEPPAGAWSNLLAPSYLAERARAIGPQSMRSPRPGAPRGAPTSLAPMPDQPEYGTSHISIVDGLGNALAMTTSIEDQFGARLMVEGFLLNNQLTDFSFAPTDAQGRLVANRVQPRKRPRSSMAPTLVFDKTTRQLALSAGSSGGAMIIHFTAKTLYGVLNWGLTAQQAIDLPNFGAIGNDTLLEERRFPTSTVEALRARGAPVQERAMTSGLQAISRLPNGWTGGADPRREGVVQGD